MKSKLLILLLSTIIVASGLFFIMRGGFIEGILFSNKKYAENIETEAYLMKEEDLSTLFQDPNNYQISQLFYKELYRGTLYLVVRLKNKGDLGAWGSLECSIYGRTFSVDVPVPLSTDKWTYFVVSLAGAGFPRDESLPKIDIEWTKLYTK